MHANVSLVGSSEERLQRQLSAATARAEQLEAQLAQLMLLQTTAAAAAVAAAEPCTPEPQELSKGQEKAAGRRAAPRLPLLLLVDLAALLSLAGGLVVYFASETV